MGALAVTFQAAFDAFLMTFVTSLAVAAAVATTKMVRRMARVERRVQGIAHRERHILRWVRRASTETRIPFPVDNDADYDIAGEEDEE